MTTKRIKEGYRIGRLCTSQEVAGYVHSLYYNVAHTEETGSILAHAPKPDTYPHQNNPPSLQLPSADTQTGPFTHILDLFLAIYRREGSISLDETKVRQTRVLPEMVKNKANGSQCFGSGSRQAKIVDRKKKTVSCLFKNSPGA